jgi:hypothetical protein
MEPLTERENGWRELRGRRRAFWIVGLGGTIGVVSLVLLLSLVNGGLAAAVFLLAVPVNVIAFSWVALRLLWFICPNCRQRFFRLFYCQFPGGWLFQHRCARCGVRAEG